MSRVETAAAMDRLPWLADEPSRQPVSRRDGIAVILAVILVVAGIAFWFGLRSAEESAPLAPSPRASTVRLPAPNPAAPVQPRIRSVPAPEVEPIVAPPTPVIEPPPPIIAAPAKPTAPAISAVEAKPKGIRAVPPQPWPVRVIDGAAGRLVRIGAFSSVHQAKRGWWAIVRVNPSLRRLPALVVPVRSMRDGRIYYRLQMGTTSQAHSAVLCQRMRMIAEPCVVIGLAAPR